MKLHTVESSMIQAFGYDAETKTLLVIFNSGKTYRYFKVPPKIYKQLLAADSKGSYMRDFVIDQYPYELAKKTRR
ncbi:KTSC domain-containing protein [Leptolyngbya sp. NK1-12]|uniref:KTSC domain-containing protein n=1 Tax=Leptolyngbya sp. NK1-12 TaxID=2547451 RepID=A0AA96WAU3_9CYAN|nr:KTSC domain-containing protein [Leptolyngbya sp. NK1-12]WNZ22957.1 KTSC domain-containing protein [Leptolyngbya sp. NK1-12]